MSQAKPFPIPVVSMLGPGSQPEDENLNFMPMPRDMSVYRPPVMPEPEEMAGHTGALEALHVALGSIQQHLAGERVQPVDLTHLTSDDRALVNQVFGEGEVAAQVTGDSGVQAQESVFAGVWRVLHREGGTLVRDTIEVGAFPQAIAEFARREGRPLPALPPITPADTMNAPAVLEELRERAANWRPGDAPHVVNLSLLPLTPGDSELLDGQLGCGRVLVLSRGYGNCRVVNTRVSNIWRVTYFNSQDMIILDTLEVGDVPEVACAAREDLQDSAERLHEVLQWVESA